MADNFNVKKFLAENKLGPYSKIKEGEAAYEYEKGKAAGEKEEKAKLKKEDADTQAEKMMDFLAEYEVIYVYGSDGKCYRKDDEGNYDEVNDYYCRMQNETKEEGYMGTQYDSSEDMAVDMVKKGITEYEVIYVYGSDGKCYRKDDEGNYDEVNDYYCRMYAEGKKEVEEGTINEYVGSELSLEIGQWVIDNYPQVADVLKAEPFGDGQEIVDLGNAVVGLATAGTLTLGAGLAMFGDSIVNAVKDAAGKLKSALSKVGSSKPSTSIAEIYEDMQIDPELMSIAAKIKAKGMNEEKTEEAMGGKNPEGDALVLRFLQGVAKKFNYPVAKAAIFVKDTIKSLGY